jgi:hypothetical protein
VSLGTLGEALDDAHDWLYESGFNPEDYDLRRVVQLHYSWNEAALSFIRREGSFEGMFRGL